MPFTATPPNYDGGSLVNLVAELEHRLTGKASAPRLDAHLADQIPLADTYVLVLFDGMGDIQLEHPDAAALREYRVGALDAPFPTTTTVSLSTIATGLPPSQHGLLGYQLYLPEIDKVVNTIHWLTPWGDEIEFETRNLLPSPNLWERLTAAGSEPISVQPAHFAGSALTEALYRGARFEGVNSVDESIDAAVQLAAVPNRLILVYLPHVDFAAHVAGQNSDEYRDALDTVTRAWEAIAHRLPTNACLVGTADHGHVDFPEAKRTPIPKRLESGRVVYGDVRATFVIGDGASMAAELPATWVPIADAMDWWGPPPRHKAFAGRSPDGILMADDDQVLLSKHSNQNLVGNHGGLLDAERRIPLLVSRK